MKYSTLGDGSAPFLPMCRPMAASTLPTTGMEPRLSRTQGQSPNHGECSRTL